MISSKHIRGAREILGWSQGGLAKRSGISTPTISNLEKDKQTPGADTLAALTRTFEKEGITFTAHGIDWRSGASYTIEGPDWWLQVLDDVYASLVDQPKAELILLGSDDRLSSAEVNNRYRKIRNANIRMRQFVRDGNTYLLGPVREYRYLPKARFVGNVTLLYGDKLAVCAQDNSQALVIKDAQLSASWRNAMELLWDTLAEPKKSTADERF